ncbi:hypothetical protein BKA65DRAFT_567073 [Rhexocercosporidium sp. MPI-PUGE-AT-0058]|nr:hypothetical protein BKA65DRAFT_567073 [Rhexocercosporidium sp. MPI-PUGE-AT-0058]
MINSSWLVLYLKWDELVSIASNLRNGIPCKLGENFSLGHFNMVRRIYFVDGISWVARVRMPALDTVFGSREVLDRMTSLRGEIACMKFLGAKTSIPVPAIHGYSINPANKVGAPYVLMDYIHCTVAVDLQVARKCESGFFGTADQDRRFKERMAEIQVELSSFRFELIGWLYQDEKTEEFFIGPEIETGKGPWETSMDYYSDLASHALKVCVSDGEVDVQTSASFALPILFEHLIALYGKDGTGPFSLTNRDFRAHNILVNDEFKIIGVIDFDIVMAAPIELVAQYPTLTGLDREAPGYVETRPLAIERIQMTKPKLEEYKNFVAAAEEVRMGEGEGGGIASLMLSDAASVVRGLVQFLGHQKSVNDKWMEAYLRHLRETVSDSRKV